MSEAEKLARIKERLLNIEVEIGKCRAVLRGEKKNV